MGDHREDRPVLSFAERWILANQYEILKRLDGEGHKFYAQVIEILSNGYESEYSYAAQYVSQAVLDPLIAHEVREILSMFRQLKWHEDEIKLTDHRHRALFHFWGFDGNNNPEHLEIADFLFRRGDYRELGMQHCPNSHSDTIETYRSMLRTWQKLQRKGLQMTIEDIMSVLDAPLIENLPVPKLPAFEEDR